MLKVNENIYTNLLKVTIYRIVVPYLANSKIKNANLIPGQPDCNPGIVSQNHEYGNEMIIKGLETRLKELDDLKWERNTTSKWVHLMSKKIGDERLKNKDQRK